MIKKLAFRYLVIFVVIIETFSVIQGYVDVPDIAVMFGVIGLAVFIYPKSFFNKATLYFILFTIILVANVIIKSFDSKWYLPVLMYWFFSLSIINVFLYNKDWIGLKQVVFVGILFVMVSSILTINSLRIDPMIVRQLTLNANESNIELVRASQKLGIASYGLVHGLPTLFPVFVFLYKKNTIFKLKLIWISIIIILYYLILKSSFATSLFLSTFVLIVSFIVSDNHKKNILIIIVSIIILIPLFNKKIAIGVLDTIKPFFIETEIDKKINDIQISIDYENKAGQLENRNTFYLNSWETFYKSPILGSREQSAAGEHSFIADFLAWFGLVGTIPLVLFFFNSFKRIYINIENNQKIYFLISLVPFIILSFVKGTPFFEQILYLLVFIPGLFLMKNQKVALG